MSWKSKASVLRAELSGKVSPLALDSMVMKFNATSDLKWKGVWDGDEDKIIAVYNKEKKVLRIDKDSPLLPMMQDKEGWTVVPSSTLASYEKVAGVANCRKALAIRKLVVKQLQPILETDEGTVEVDLGEDRGDRYKVLDALIVAVERKHPLHSYKIDALYRTCRLHEKRVYTVELKKPTPRIRVTPIDWSIPVF